jgi:hypothetical protein
MHKAPEVIAIPNPALTALLLRPPPILSLQNEEEEEEIERDLNNVATNGR